MSLDVYLTSTQGTPCKDCDGSGVTYETLFHSNITHNLVEMAEHAELYKACWKPEDLGITRSAKLAPLLRDGLKRLIAEPDRFKKYNPRNGWGSYQTLVDFVEMYLLACEENPLATISVDR